MADQEQAGRTPAEEDVRAYLKALEERDLDKCVSFFSDDAVINFMEGLYQGLDHIRKWHEDRFQANLRITEVEDIQIEGDSITVYAVIQSDRLLEWKIPHLSGYATARFRDGKIQELRFGLNVTNPLEDWS